ncbi:MAG: sulfurtransferase TusA family protein [Candidatus Poseidoniales archaeon]|nr:MAG: sulfurtransferase TusA family protein [Candidatus Poseidoniales archaeon]
MVDGDIVSLNLLGFLCPVPVHETRRAVEKSAQGTLFEVLCDDPETLHDIPALCDRMGLVLLGVNEDAGEYAFRIEKR